MQRINPLSKSESGQGLVEIGLIIVLVAMVSVLALSATGTSLREIYCNVISGLGIENACTDAFLEDFSDISDWHKSWGNCDVSNGELCCNRWGGIFNTEYSGEDYTIDVGKANLAKGNGYGVWFRAQDYDRPEGYIFQYDPGYAGGAFLFRKWVDGHELRPFAVQRDRNFDWHGADHQVQIVANGNTFTAYVDGEEVLTATDDTYQEGGVGVRTWDRTQACFDDLMITSP
jgi:Flp pilus assembly pilin Flp